MNMNADSSKNASIRINHTDSTVRAQVHSFLKLSVQKLQHSPSCQLSTLVQSIAPSSTSLSGMNHTPMHSLKTRHTRGPRSSLLIRLHRASSTEDNPAQHLARPNACSKQLARILAASRLCAATYASRYTLVRSALLLGSRKRSFGPRSRAFSCSIERKQVPGYNCVRKVSKFHRNITVFLISSIQLTRVNIRPRAIVTLACLIAPLSHLTWTLPSAPPRVCIHPEYASHPAGPHRPRIPSARRQSE
jgi:hypothetical protein